MSRSMLSRIAIALALVACCLTLAACDWFADWFNDSFYNRYSDDEYNALMTIGQETMEEWVGKNMPGGEIEDLHAHMYQYLSGPSYLTDYVDATVKHEGETHELMLNTATGEMYERDYDGRLKDALSRQLPEMLGVDGAVDYRVTGAELFVPYSHECTGEDADIDGLRVNMLPYGTDDVDAYVTDYAKRPLIAVSFEADSSQDERANVDKLTHLKSIFALKESCGLFVTSMSVYSDEILVDMYNEGALTFERKGWFDIGDFSIFVFDEEYSEVADSRTGQITTTEKAPFDPGRDLVIEETKDGYRFTLAESVFPITYRIGAPEGSPALDSGYHVRILEEEPSEIDLHWDTTTLDRPVLVDDDGRIFATLFEVELTRAE